jgi:hypothetical protein
MESYNLNSTFRGNSDLFGCRVHEPVAVLRDEPPVTEQLKSGVHKIIASSLKALSDLARARASMPVDARGLKGP